MLSQVLAVVAAEGWFDTAVEYEKTIYLSHGSSQCVLLSRNGRPDTFVKFNELTSLGTEATRCAAACRRLPDLAPRFVGHARRGSLEVLATQAVEFRSLTSGMACSGRDGAALRSGLEQYFGVMRQGGQEARAAGEGYAWFADMCAYFEANSIHPDAVAGLNGLRATLERLPALPQHGDLVLNNLGLRPDLRLVIFDWEDFGAVTLPGLDLFTLETSLRQDLAQQSFAQPATMAARALDLDRMCRALGLARDMYEDLRTGYALTFRYLKRHYSPEIRARLDSIIAGAAGVDT